MVVNGSIVYRSPLTKRQKKKKMKMKIKLKKKKKKKKKKFCCISQLAQPVRAGRDDR
jgi:hypothetical protein